MAWSNLLSGLIGALLGGLFSIVASVITRRQQRSQARQGTSDTASSAIVDNILAIKQAMTDIQKAKDSKNNSSFETVRAAAERILFVYNVLIADKVLRSRISELINVVNVVSECLAIAQLVNQKRIDSIISHMDNVRKSIQAHLDDQPLPRCQSPPDLLAIKNA
jgi:hypothetical protein